MNYLYNGVELPALPEWDKKTYPYVVIHEFGLHVDRTLYTVQATTVESYIKHVKMSDGKTISTRLYHEPPRLYAENENEADIWYGTDYTTGQQVYDEFVLKNTQTYSDMIHGGENRGRIVWSNHDILNEDGSIYFAKSNDPIPVNPAPPIDPTSLLMGWLVGKRIAGMRDQVTPEPDAPQEPDKEPVAYLYNGVRLPDINTVWTDKETYPYASIATVTGVVCLGLQGLQYQTDGTNLIVVPGYKGLWYILSDGAWVYNQIEDYPDGMTLPLSMFTATWTSADIINTTDNSVYLAATEPVPVYE